MGSCTRRHFLLSTCFLQMITIIERQVFDFLGYMWAPILVNFFHILFIIFGFYGAYHFRVKYIITYLIWSFLWIGWNAFLICFYLNVGDLDRNSDLLNLGTGSVSWFEVNGYGCKPIYSENITLSDEETFRPPRPLRVDDCFLDYTIVEIIHSGVQCALAVFGILGAILISCIFLDEDDRFDFMNGDAKSPQHTVVHPMYVSYTSIPTSASATMQSNKHLQHHQQQLQQQQLLLLPTTTATTTQQQQEQTNSLQFQYHHQHHPHNNNKHYKNHNNNNNNSNNNTLINNHHNHQQQQQTHKLSQNPHNANSKTFLSQANGQQDNSNPNSLNRHHHNHQKRSRQAAVSPLASSTTPSLSYASLQNSNLYLGSAGVGRASTSLNNSNYSIFNAVSNDTSTSSAAGHFARIHHKPKAPKSLTSSASGGSFARPEVKYTQMQLDRLSRNLEEDEDNFQLPSGNGVTYVPFQSPTPNSLFVGENNNAGPHIIFNAYRHASPLSHPSSANSSPNNNTHHQRGAIFPYEQNGLPIMPAYASPKVLRSQKVPPRPTNIPLPTVPVHQCGQDSLTPETPSPPPAPRPQPHIFQQRLGHAPYPDLSPEITEKYAMPTQYVPSSPMVKRIQRRQRQQPAQANFCDQIRDAPPGYIDRGGHHIVRAKSDDRLMENGERQSQLLSANAAPHVNRRSGRRGEGKTRPRSYCNSIVGVQA